MWLEKLHNKNFFVVNKLAWLEFSRYLINLIFIVNLQASSNLNNTNAHGIKCEGIWFYPEPELPTMYKNPFMPPFNPVPIKDVHYCIHYFPDGSWLLKPIQGMMTQQMWSGLVGRVHFHNLIIHNINMQAQLHNSQALERNAEPPIVLDSHYSTQESWRSISNNVQTAAPCVTTATFQVLEI